jgi:hypothetical protein
MANAQNVVLIGKGTVFVAMVMQDQIHKWFVITKMQLI